MWDTRSVALTVRLPKDIADQAEQVQTEDPEFLSRVVLYGMTRRSIYRHLRDHTDDRSPRRLQEEGARFAARSEMTDHERRILDEADADGKA